MRSRPRPDQQPAPRRRTHAPTDDGTHRKRTGSRPSSKQGDTNRGAPRPAAPAVKVAPPPLRQDPELFISCLPGLEPFLLREIEGLDLGLEATLEAGGCTLPTGDPEIIYRLNLELGVAVRVLLRLGTFHCRSLGELVRKSSRVPWRDWLLPARFAVRAESRLSRLYHRDAIAERVTQGIVEVVGDRVRERDDVPGTGAPTVLARFLHDTCTLSLDTSGTPLHDRGYRAEPGPAPLREDLARALILASGWNARSPLIDPFAGCGTIAIEAALLARRLPPGHAREFAFAHTRLFNAARWEKVRAQAQARSVPLVGRVLASDRRTDCADITTRNAERAGVHGDIDVVAASLSESPWRAHLAEAGAVVTDPPHGRRLGDVAALGSLYRSLGVWLQTASSACGIAILSGDRRLTLRTGLPLKTAFLANHGGARVRALVRPVAGAAPVISDDARA